MIQHHNLNMILQSLCRGLKRTSLPQTKKKSNSPPATKEKLKASIESIDTNFFTVHSTFKYIILVHKKSQQNYNKIVLIRNIKFKHKSQQNYNNKIRNKSVNNHQYPNPHHLRRLRTPWMMSPPKNKNKKHLFPSALCLLPFLILFLQAC